MSDIPEINADKPNNTSLYLALLAILISLVGTGVSIFETKLLREQQELMVEEKAASVWPYVDMIVSGGGDAYGDYFFVGVENKGIGPALIGEISFIVGGEPFTEERLPEGVAKHYPGISMKARNIAFKPFIKSVLSPEEDGTVVNFLAEIDTTKYRKHLPLDSLITVELCYCSVYGDCWTVNGEDKPLRTEDCPAKLDLR